MKIVAKNQNVRCDQVAADDALEEAVERSRRATRGSSARRRAPRVICRVATCANTISADRDDPGDDHRVRDREAERPRDFHRALR